MRFSNPCITAVQKHAGRSVFSRMIMRCSIDLGESRDLIGKRFTGSGVCVLAGLAGSSHFPIPISFIFLDRL